MNPQKAEREVVDADMIRCHIKYIKQTSEHPERDIAAFKRYVRFVKGLKSNRHERR